MFSLKNKTVVITGANGLLGITLVESCLNMGAKTIACDINDNQLKPFLDQFPGQFFFHSTDITSESSIEAIIQQLDHIDGWVNCAYPRTHDWGKDIEEFPMDSWRKNIDMHLNGYYMCSSKVLKKMKDQKSGSLLNFASIYGLLGPDFSVYEGTDLTSPVAYSAIKGGIINFTRYLASYYGAYNIRVNCVSPGGVYDHQNKDFVKNYNKKVPLKRMAEPQDISGSVIFLLSDQSSYVTGQNLIVDGGWSCV